MTEHNDETTETPTRPSDGWLTLRQAIDITLGGASTCWIPDAGDAEFDSVTATKLGDELEHYVRTTYDTVLNPNRSKGEKIVLDCLLHEEPFFVFRGRDIFSPMVLKQYLKQLEDYGPDDPDMQAGVVAFISILRTWQAKNIAKVRYPD